MADEKTLVLKLDVIGIREEAEELARVDQVLKNLGQTKREYLKTIGDVEKLTSKEAKQLALLNTEIKENQLKRAGLNKTVTNAIKLNKENAGSIGSLRIKNSELRKEMNELNLTTKQGVARLNELRVAYLKNVKQIRDFDRSISGSNTLVGEYSRGISGAFSKIGSSIGALGVGFIALNAIKDAFNTIKEFEKGISGLQAITGAAGEDLDALKTRAVDLSTVYGKSAIEIVDAMKLVGSAKPELLQNVQALGDMTEAVLTLSQASGMDLA